ncbi:MAG: hypothetical protein BHV87_04270 [Clostridiales bacterium 36_14]|nr:MAG: hypothetical protein BHV87_04270 [Clostridiales bacterium 36_14]
MTKISKIIKGVPSSFVFKNMKLDTDKGAGEAKLFVGPKSQIEDINDFFKFDQAYSYRFDKANLLNYLHEVKMEYVFQHVNKYKDASIETWQEFYTTVENMQDSEMQIHLIEFTDTSRVYVRANEEIFGKLFRKITVPKLTDVEFVRDDDTREIIVLLKVNYEYDKESNESSEVAITDGIIFNTGYESTFSRNRILFGAPGTGKSFTINRDRMELLGKDNEDDYERVTFHPEYSYANFVGTYKPVMVDDSAKIISLASEKEVLAVLTDETKSAQEKYDQLYDRFKGDGLTRLPLLLGLYTDESFKTRKADGSDAAGDNSVERNHGRAIRPYVNLSKPSSGKKDISYEYVPGPFMRMYVKALKNSRTDNIKPFLLIIEEINRANVAAVFGDIFQLLDRGDDFVSEYPIQATEDVKKYLAKELGGDPCDYNKIKIPDNMFIWATMNSADQGVFPMDTAFKRRWDFTYLGIDDNDQDLQGKYVYLADDKSQKVEWNKLRKAINNFLAKEKINEDKQLGPYFISRSIVVPNDSEEIDRDRFINTFKNKVIMYLFEDAAKQKRPRLFEGCFLNSSRYSEICREFEAKGVGIFNHDIQLDCEVEDVKYGDTTQE